MGKYIHPNRLTKFVAALKPNKTQNIMKRTILAIFFAAAALTSYAQAPRGGEGQQIPAEFRRMFRRTPGDTLQSVRINPDGSTTISIYAPKAHSVSLQGDGGFVPMAFGGGPRPQFIEGENGVWSMTVKDVKPGLYRYHFVVDGMNVYDPKNAGMSDISPIATISDGNDYFSMKNVPHGAISQRYYFSKTLGTWRRMHVWTPAGYETSKKKLPVLYLIHGGGDTDNSWPTVGAAGMILDNLLAEGKMEPMIVVMPNGTITNVPDEVPPFAADMVTDIIPFIESNYPVLTDKDHRAIAGLSMGGMETMETAFNNIDMFSYVWVLSSSFQPSRDPKAEAERLGVYKNAQKMNKSFKKLVFTQGGESDIAYRNCINTRKELDAAGLKYEYMENAQEGHSWGTWRADLFDLAQKIFK